MKKLLLIAGFALTLTGCATYGPPPPDDGGYTPPPVVVDPYPCDRYRDPFCTYPAPPPVIIVPPVHDHPHPRPEPRPPIDPGHGGHGGWGGGGDHRPPMPGPVGPRPGGPGRRDVPAKAEQPSGKVGTGQEQHLH